MTAQEKKVKTLLCRGTLVAVELLLATIKDVNEPTKVRLDCAKEVLNRAYGRGAMTQQTDDRGQAALRFELSEELECHAK